MKNKETHTDRACMLLLLLLGGCGGGGGGVGALAGIEGSGNQNPVDNQRISSAGVVTALGSIVVNGVKYELGSASITIDGQRVTEGELKVGQVLIAEGRLNADKTTGTATRVTAEQVLTGAIDEVDLSLNQLHILGQIVEVDANTVIAEGSPDRLLGGLTATDTVAVSALFTASGHWVARRITKKAATTPLAVTGPVSRLDTTARKFFINELEVDYSSAVVSGFSGQNIVANASVRVEGARLTADRRLIADRVNNRNLALPGQTGDSAALQGWITRFASATDFDVDGHPVTTTASTRIEADEAETPGLSALRLDALVNVSGRIIANGVVEAALVQTNNIITLDSEITGVDSNSISATFVPWSGSSCQITANTGMTLDGFPAVVQNLHRGQVATIYARFTAGNPTTPPSATCQTIEAWHAIRGPLESKPADSPSFRIMGQRVWMQSASAALDTAAIGDMMVVSGHLTSSGDLLATDVRKALAIRNHQVTGFVRSVDAAGSIIRVGELDIDLGSATIGGFPSGLPVVGDRVIVIADTPPVAGLWLADVIRNGALRPRGAAANLVRTNGLVTALGTGGSISVEGRASTPLQFNDQGVYLDQRCDPAKLHLDLPLHVTSIGHPGNDGLRYFPPLCPHGRRNDERGTVDYDLDTEGLNVNGDVQSIDVTRGTIEVAGIKLDLLPSSILTSIDHDNRASSGNPRTAPMNLADFQSGQHVLIDVPGPAFSNGLRPVRRIWAVSGAVPPEYDVSLQARYRSASADRLELEFGVQVETPGDTRYEGYNCEEDFVYSDRQKFLEDASTSTNRLLVDGDVVGNSIIARRIKLTPVCESAF